MNLGVALCIKTGLPANGVTPECCTQRTWEWHCASRRDYWPMVLHLNVAFNEPGSGIVHQDGTPGQWCYTRVLHSMNLEVALCIETGLLTNGVTPECCTQ